MLNVVQLVPSTTGETGRFTHLTLWLLVNGGVSGGVALSSMGRFTQRITSTLDVGVTGEGGGDPPFPMVLSVNR